MSETLLVDLDGCLVDLLPTWLRLYGVHTGEWIHQDSITAYNHEKFVKRPELFWDVLGAALVNAPPVTGSKVFNALCRRYDTYVVTYAHHSAPQAFQHKIEWMQRYFPEFPQDRIIFTKQKHLVRGDILLEDCEANIDAWFEANPTGDGYLVAAPYNNPELSETWAEIAEKLL